MAGVIVLVVLTATTIILIHSAGLLDPWRPRGVSVLPIAFALASTAALMNAGLRAESVSRTGVVRKVMKHKVQEFLPGRRAS